MDVRLTLKSTINVIGSVCDFTYKWAFNAGLTDEDAARFTLAVDELVTDVVLFAYPDEPGEFEISFIRSPSTVEVVVHELGEPFNPDRHTYDRDAALREGKFEGAGFELIRSLVDDFIFLNKGKGGKEFRITKVVTSEHIAELVVEEELKKPVEPSAPSVDYVLNLMTVEDAEDAAKLIYRTYGYTYIKEELYFPKKIEMALEQGDKFGVIVRTPAGEAVGYFAVLRTTNSMIGEVGEAVVLMGHRRRGIMTLMLNALIEESQQRGLLGLFGEAVTVHTISQQANLKFNFQSTALLLGAFPTSQYKGLVEAYPQAVSIVIDVLPFTSFATTAVYLPDAYAAILTDIYAQLGLQITKKEPGAVRLQGASRFAVAISYTFRHAQIEVEHYGEDFSENVRQMVDDLIHKDIEAIFLDLPLKDPRTALVVDGLRAQGFVFSGLMPLFHHEDDYLRLQHLSAPLDFDLIHVYSDMAHRIKAFIAEELQWTTSLQATR